jgi:hypothetical protein
MLQGAGYKPAPFFCVPFFVPQSVRRENMFARVI